MDTSEISYTKSISLKFFQSSSRFGKAVRAQIFRHLNAATAFDLYLYCRQRLGFGYGIFQR